MISISKTKGFIIIIVSILFSCLPVLSSENEQHAGKQEHNENNSQQHQEGEEAVEHDEQHGSSKFDPKTFIFHHVQDAHEWHIIDIKEKSIAVPLPILIYSKHSGFHFFMSNKLSHGNTWENFSIPHHGKNEGKIVEILADGTEFIPLDISITKNVAAAIFSSLLMLWLFISIAKRYKRNPNGVPRGKQSFFEPIIIFIRDEIAKPSIGEHHYKRFMPYLLTIFFFIWINNMLGLIPVIPGGSNLTGNIAVTASLALFTFIITTFSGNKNYWKHIFNTPGVPWWLKVPLPLMPAIELLGMLIKPFTLLVRLFANITAGHIIVLSFFGLIFIFGEMKPLVGYLSTSLVIPFTIFMTFLELLVALLQAYVFTLLSALYFGMATEEHH